MTLSNYIGIYSLEGHTDRLITPNICRLRLCNTEGILSSVCRNISLWTQDVRLSSCKSTRSCVTRDKRGSICLIVHSVTPLSHLPQLMSLSLLNYQNILNVGNTRLSMHHWGCHWYSPSWSPDKDSLLELLFHSFLLWAVCCPLY